MKIDNLLLFGLIIPLMIVFWVMVMGIVIYAIILLWDILISRYRYWKERRYYIKSLKK